MLSRKLTVASRRRGEGRLDLKHHFDRGAAAVEMALVMPILILMVMGIIDFGRIFNGQIQLSQAAREGARIAALGTSGYSVAAVEARATAALNNPAMQGGAVTISVDVVTVGGATVGTTSRVCQATDITDNYGRVTITIPYDKILFGPTSLSQKAIMKCSG